MAGILVFGDSNTWGLVPGSKTYRRYPRSVRWTGLLQKKCKTKQIIEEGLCGRTTVFEDTYRPGRKGIASLPEILENHSTLEAAVIMLGTNDCKSVYAATPSVIGEGMDVCVNEIEKYLPSEKILLISPIYLGDEVWRPDKDPEFGHRSIEVSRALKDVYRKIADRRGNAFLAASDYAKADDADNEHMNGHGHSEFAKAVYDKLKEMNVLSA